MKLCRCGRAFDSQAPGERHCVGCGHDSQCCDCPPLERGGDCESRAGRFEWAGCLEGVEDGFHDCATMPCGDCPERVCEGGCGQTDEDCCCEPQEYPPPPGQDLAYELAKPEASP